MILSRYNVKLLIWVLYLTLILPNICLSCPDDCKRQYSTPWIIDNGKFMLVGQLSAIFQPPESPNVHSFFKNTDIKKKKKMRLCLVLWLHHLRAAVPDSW